MDRKGLAEELRAIAEDVGDRFCIVVRKKILRIADKIDPAKEQEK